MNNVVVCRCLNRYNKYLIKIQEFSDLATLQSTHAILPLLNLVHFPLKFTANSVNILNILELNRFLQQFPMALQKCKVHKRRRSCRCCCRNRTLFATQISVALKWNVDANRNYFGLFTASIWIQDMHQYSIYSILLYCLVRPFVFTNWYSSIYNILNLSMQYAPCQSASINPISIFWQIY